MTTLRTTEPAGQAMKVHTQVCHTYMGQARIRVTVYAYDGVRYIKAQQKTVPYPFHASHPHKAAIDEAFGRVMAKGETNASQAGGWFHWAVIA